MDQLLMSEVNDEILKIWSKKNQDNSRKNEGFCNETNLDACLKLLTQEFDYLDVCCLDQPLNLNNTSSLKAVLVQLCNSSHNLLNLHKETRKEHENCLEIHSKLASDARTLQKNVISLRNEIAAKDKQLHLNKEKIVLDRLENTNLRSKITNAQKEIQVVRKQSVSEKNRHGHEVQKITVESRRLEEKFRKNCGEYVSKEGQIVTVINNLQSTEAQHLEMIEKLQKNNYALLEEIVRLKEELDSQK